MLALALFAVRTQFFCMIVCSQKYSSFSAMQAVSCNLSTHAAHVTRAPLHINQRMYAGTVHDHDIASSGSNNVTASSMANGTSALSSAAICCSV
jgi:hypothetical protein